MRGELGSVAEGVVQVVQERGELEGGAGGDGNESRPGEREGKGREPLRCREEPLKLRGGVSNP